jgi:hypothetical protein
MHVCAETQKSTLEARVYMNGSPQKSYRSVLASKARRMTFFVHVVMPQVHANVQKSVKLATTERQNSQLPARQGMEEVLW